MKTLHVAPSDSAGAALRKAVADAGRDDDVLAFRDDLSCGPISSDDPASRAQWWSSFYDAAEAEQTFQTFWDRIATTSDRLVVWFGRHSASELAFFHALADRLEHRSYEIVDVTGLRLPFVRRDGSPGIGVPTQAVGPISDDNLRQLLGSERLITESESEQYAKRWRILKDENAHFRVVTVEGLTSASGNYFDLLLLERATRQWKGVFRVIGETMGYNLQPYFQVGDVMLLARIMALVEQGKLVADGDLEYPRKCRVRLAN